jgi:hypothetical protein
MMQTTSHLDLIYRTALASPLIPNNSSGTDRIQDNVWHILRPDALPLKIAGMAL